MYNMNKSLLYTVIIFFIAQSFGWFQANGQFISKWFKEYPIFWSFTLGGVTSYLFMLGHKYSYESFGGVTWPGRMLAFSIGIVIFTAFAWFFLGESLSAKTIISLVLAAAIIGIQIAF